VVLDCKSGADSRRVADRFRGVLRDAGARSTAVWPDEMSLSLWDLPPVQPTSTLMDMIEHGTGAAAYYTDVMEAIVALAVSAPAGPSAGAHDFLSRLDVGWLTRRIRGRGPGRRRGTAAVGFAPHQRHRAAVSDSVPPARGGT
jgi:hypothetical protein